MTDVYNVIYSPLANKDLKNIYLYISYKLLSPNTAKNQLDRIRKSIRSLDFMPSRNPIVDWEPWKSLKIHRLPIDKYIIYYTVEEKELSVTIIRIVYSGRNLQSILKD